MQKKYVLRTLIFTTILTSSSILAADSFNYQNYPASAMNRENMDCSSSNFETDYYTLNEDEQRYPDLASVPFQPGDTIHWKSNTLSNSCFGQPLSLAIYAAPYKELDTRSKGLQTIVNKSTSSSWGRNTVSLKVPKTFCGPYQIDAVVGRPLPKVGKDFGFYGIKRDERPSGDTRNMLVDGANGTMVGTARHGVCREVSSFPDLAYISFDYKNYPHNQLTEETKNCSAADIQSATSGLGFYLNGDYIGSDLGNNIGEGTPNLVLKPGDRVRYVYENITSDCVEQKVTLALYRNPNGAFGLDNSKNQRLVTFDSHTISNSGNYLEITVPDSFDGGWQLDVALGEPIPIIGSVGARYNNGTYNMLKTAAAGFIGK